MAFDFDAHDLLGSHVTRHAAGFSPPLRINLDREVDFKRRSGSCYQPFTSSAKLWRMLQLVSLASKT